MFPTLFVLCSSSEIRYGYTQSNYFVDEDMGPLTAVIELAASSGIPQIPFTVFVSNFDNTAICELYRTLENAASFLLEDTLISISIMNLN